MDTVDELYAGVPSDRLTAVAARLTDHAGYAAGAHDLYRAVTGRPDDAAGAAPAGQDSPPPQPRQRRRA